MFHIEERHRFTFFSHHRFIGVFLELDQSDPGDVFHIGIVPTGWIGFRSSV
ncbi:hypothetical protein X975_06837, partial [Stegodyphus mimosarum]